MLVDHLVALLHCMVWLTFGRFSTVYSTPGTFSVPTSTEVPSESYRYQNVTCKPCWSLIGQRESSLPVLLNLRHETPDLLDLNQHSQWRIERNCFEWAHFFSMVCWRSTDVPLVDSRGADLVRAWWGDAEKVFQEVAQLLAAHGYHRQ